MFTGWSGAPNISFSAVIKVFSVHAAAFLIRISPCSACSKEYLTSSTDWESGIINLVMSGSVTGQNALFYLPYKERDY